MRLTLRKGVWQVIGGYAGRKFFGHAPSRKEATDCFINFISHIKRENRSEHKRIG